jgi:hypothetical protein
MLSTDWYLLFTKITEDYASCWIIRIFFEYSERIFESILNNFISFYTDWYTLVLGTGSHVIIILHIKFGFFAVRKTSWCVLPSTHQACKKIDDAAFVDDFRRVFHNFFATSPEMNWF